MMSRDVSMSASRKVHVCSLFSFHSSSATAAAASGIFIVCSMGMNLCTGLNELNLRSIVIFVAIFSKRFVVD